jgi:hypothetical protein
MQSSARKRAVHTHTLLDAQVFALTEHDPKLSGNAPWRKSLDTLRGQVRCSYLHLP